MWKFKSTHDDVGDEVYDDLDLAQLEMRIMADDFALRLECHVAHLPWCSVIYNDRDEWRMMWCSSIDAAG